jgi:VWFA-related protein
MKLRAAAFVSLALACPPAAAQQPAFQTRVEVMSLDVTVVDGAARPVADLTAGDFTVRVDGQPRRVVSAQWIPQVAAADGPDRSSSISPGAGYVSNSTAGAASSLVIIAIDEAATPFGRIRPVLPALNRFVDRRPAGDRIAVVSFGLGKSAWTDFTADRELVKRKLAEMPGQKLTTTASFSHHVGLAAALGYWRREQDALRSVIQRECRGAPVAGRAPAATDCVGEVEAEALKVAQEALHNADVTLANLREVIGALRTIEAPKTLLLVSDGLAYEQTGGAQPVAEIGELAAGARTTIYTLKLEEPQFDDNQAQSPLDLERDQMERLQGLQALTLAAGGALFRLTGTGTGIFDRVESEMSGYYLLGVEPTARDRDGKSRPVQIAVSRPGLTVRSKRSVATDGQARPREAQGRLNAALANPLPLSAVPLRGVAFAMGGPDPASIQLLIHADIGAEYTAARTLSVAHLVLDSDRQSVDGQISDLRFTPRAAGVPAPFEYARTVTVKPGDYVVKIAVADGDLIGSLEMPVHASLIDVPPARFSQLIVGGPLGVPNLLRPTVGSRVLFGTVHGYLEGYGRDIGAVRVSFEVATQDDAPLLQVDVPARLAGAERAIFSAVLPVDQLPPGEYLLRAVVRGQLEPLTTLTRAFEVPASAPAAASTVFLPVAATDLGRSFDLEDALRPATVSTFRTGLNAEEARLFDEGIAHLQGRRYLDAATTLERAVQLGGDANPSLAYLGASFAAAGHDSEALAVWRKAAAAGTPSPDLHEWLIESLLRTKSYGEARAAAERAVKRWPSEARFARPLALLDATAGKAREAILGLERYLERQPDDAGSLYLAVNWLFNAHRAGLNVHELGEALGRARSYAQRYAEIGGPQKALVSFWVKTLEK